MNLHPASLDELRAALNAANAKREHIASVDLRAFTRMVEYEPADMTVTAEAGLTLAALQARLAEHGQWLPVDPANADRLTLADLLNANLSGPRCFGYGTIREHLLGLRVALADGRVIKSGGKVVKNVAGYDLLKLYVGSHGTLGVIVEATFKVRPLPEREDLIATSCATFEQASALIEAVLASELTPVVLDLHCLAERGLQAASASEGERPSKRPEGRPPFTLVLGFAGTREEVEWQTARATELCQTAPASLDYDHRFWRTGSAEPVQRLSVLPSRLASALETLGAAEFVARAGNGVVYYRAGTPPPKAEVPAALTRGVKDIFDPNHVFPELPL